MKVKSLGYVVIGLYYPYIHFKSDSWFKLSALYWDRMARIVPESFSTDDSDVVKSISKFVINIDPGKVHPRFHNTFGELLVQHEEQLRNLYGIEFRDSWPEIPIVKRPPSAGGPSGEEPRLAYVYYEKVTSDLLEMLSASKLVMVDPGDDRWVGMHPKLAQVYMMSLADQMAGELELRPVTDETFNHVAASGITVERLAHALLGDVDLVDVVQGEQEIKMAAAMVALELVLPEDLHSLDPDKIMRFRESRAGGRKCFQEYIEEFVKDRTWLSKIEDEEALRGHLEAEFEKTLKPELDEIRDELNSLGIATITSCLNVKVVVPSTFVTVAAAFGQTLDPIVAAGASLAACILPVLIDKRKAARQILKSSDATYLHRVEADISPSTVLESIQGNSRKFLLGV